MSLGTEIAGLIADYAQYVIFAVGLLISWITGRAYQRFKVEQLGREISKVRSEVDTLRVDLQRDRFRSADAASQHSAQLASLEASIHALNSTIDRMHQDIRGKQDRK